MKITLLQRNIEWANPTLNIQRAEEAIDRKPGADLYVLPEMFSTGFCMEPKEAKGTNEETLVWMKHEAKVTGAAIAGSLIVAEEGKFFNRFYFVKPNGQVEKYDKRHLFTFGGEHHRFTAGNERVIVEWQGVRILLQICYDLRFPVWSRNRGDYDLILYVASWPASRRTVWNTLLPARAIENQCYVAGVNRVGTDPACEYSGESVLIDPYGKSIATCAMNEECEASAYIDIPRLEAFRKKFPVLDDADEFEWK